MKNRNSRDIGRLLGLLSDPSVSRGFLPVSEEPLTNHRRGQRFKSSITHHISGLNSVFPFSRDYVYTNDLPS